MLTSGRNENADRRHAPVSLHGGNYRAGERAGEAGPVCLDRRGSDAGSRMRLGYCSARAEVKVSGNRRTTVGLARSFARFPVLGSPKSSWLLAI